MMKKWYYCELIAVVVLMMSTVAYAHKITTFAYVEGNVVHTETYFSDGTKAKHALVRVYDAHSGKLLLEGHTDKQGIFEFKPPKITDLKIVVTAELGHQAKTLIKASDLKAEATTNPSNTASSSSSSDFFVNSTTKPTSGTSINAQQLRQIVAEEVNKQIHPVLEQIVQIKEQLAKPSFVEIAGGIGYILGFFGLWAMWRKR